MLADQFGHLLLIHEFFCDDGHLGLIRPFQRYSAFHCFIEEILSRIVRDEVAEVDLEERQREQERYGRYLGATEDMGTTQMPIERLLRVHGIRYASFGEWLSERGSTFMSASASDLDDFNEELYETQQFADLLTQLVREVFYLLFQNRHLLLLFNDMVADHVKETRVHEIDADEYRPYFDRDGILRRASIPSWAQRAVFFRDRGKCVLCRQDMSNLVSIGGFEHYDHIVPLAEGGLNDVTNLQLLCAKCNLSKGGRRGSTSDQYEAWYDMKDG